MNGKASNIKTWVPLALTGMLFAYTSCSSEHGSHKSQDRIPGTWQATPIVADGKRTDWPTPYPYEDKKAMISYAVSNDQYNLYITAATGDPSTELKILRNGLVVWIDRTASKDKTMSICFPSDNNRNNGGQNISSRDMPQHIDEALANVNEFFIQGFKGCRGKFTLQQGDSCGVKVGVGLDEYDQLVWEVVIPFKTFYTKNEIDMHDRGRPIDICFDIEGLQPPANRPNNGGMHMGGMGFGVGGMGMGMGMGPGMGGHRYGGGTENEQLYKSASFWKKVGIAFKQQ
jgi:hypothetical protein